MAACSANFNSTIIFTTAIVPRNIPVLSTVPRTVPYTAGELTTDPTGKDRTGRYKRVLYTALSMKARKPHSKTCRGADVRIEAFHIQYPQ